MTANGKAGALMAKDFMDQFHKDLSPMPAEEEVRAAQMESRLRGMILEVLKPTVAKAMKLQTVYDMLTEKFNQMCSTIHEVAIDLSEISKRTDMVVMVQKELERHADLHEELVQHVTHQEKAISTRVKLLEDDLEQQKNVNNRLSRSIEHAVMDITSYEKKLQEVRYEVDASFASHRKDHSKDFNRIDTEMREIRERHQSLSDQVWGSEDMSVPDSEGYECDEVPSLWLFHRQHRRFKSAIEEVKQDIGQLKRLEDDSGYFRERINAHEVQIDNVDLRSNRLQEELNKLESDTKDDIKRTSNLMASFSANLLKESRAACAEGSAHSARLREEVSTFMLQSQEAIKRLDASVTSTGAHISAAMNEVRTDLKGLDERRKRDKLLVEEMTTKLDERIKGAFSSADLTLRGLEHVSRVVNLALQSERMSILLDAQDFADRSETPYVGCVVPSEGEQSTRRRVGRSGNVDIDHLVRLCYRPKPVTFAGVTLERQQVLAVRERLLQNAQDALLRGRLPRSKGAQPEALAVEKVLDEVDKEWTRGKKSRFFISAGGASSNVDLPFGWRGSHLGGWGSYEGSQHSEDFFDLDQGALDSAGCSTEAGGLEACDSLQDISSSTVASTSRGTSRADLGTASSSRGPSRGGNGMVRRGRGGDNRLPQLQACDKLFIGVDSHWTAPQTAR